MAMATWTIDAGFGLDDLAAFITSQGEVIVYRGTDPSSAATWALVGVYWMGSPVGRRCYTKYAGDVLIITQDGLVPLSGALQSSRTNPRVALSDKIKFAISTAVDTYGNNFGWQVIPFPQQNMVIVNVPFSQISQQQYVMNEITGSWCNFSDVPATCWELFQDNLYFATSSGLVYQFWTGFDDTLGNIGGGGGATAIQSFNNFGSQGKIKRFTSMRPIFRMDQLPVSSNAIKGNINIDFDKSQPTPSLSASIIAGGVWDQSLWDSGVWVDDLGISRNFQGTSGVGYWGAPALQVAITGVQFRWVSTDVVVESGGVL